MNNSLDFVNPLNHSNDGSNVSSQRSAAFSTDSRDLNAFDVDNSSDDEDDKPGFLRKSLAHAPMQGLANGISLKSFGKLHKGGMGDDEEEHEHDHIFNSLVSSIAYDRSSSGSGISRIMRSMVLLP
eukprot:SAG11_NODE_2648_length_3128_cov_1.284252_1_plen_126_part_00